MVVEGEEGQLTLLDPALNAELYEALVNSLDGVIIARILNEGS